ncbi:MAG: outer membrane beta-barrel protein [Thiobacillaceae bacterium]
MRKMHLVAAITSALVLSTPATAGFFDLTLAPYVGASIGQSTADITCQAATSCDDSSLAGKIYGGLEVNEYISMELGYANLGTFDYTGATVGSREAKGLTVQVVGTYVLNPSVTLIGKGGFGILNTKVHQTTPVLDVGDNDLEWSMGLGGQYNFTKSVGLRLEWERYHKVGSPAPGTGEVNIDMFTTGLVYKF